MNKDIHDQPLSGANAQAAEHFDNACALLRRYIDDPSVPAQAALAAAPEMTMGHVLMAYLNLLGTEPLAIPAAQAAHAAAAVLPATEREALHVRAVGALSHGRWHEAGSVLEDITARHPRDLLALQAGHAIDFFTGRTRMLRDRIARAESHWHEGMPGHHAVLSMLAFGLEENADYADAERYGKRAVELEPLDGWGWHAVAHVMEMQNRRADGVAWFTRDTQAWSERSFFAVHNWWHLALFHLGLEQIDEVMALVDRRILGNASPLVLDMVDASAMLWRLQLRGVAVGERWQALADRWAAVSADSSYAFNDMHAMMAFVGADRTADAERLLAAQQRALARDDDNREFLRDVGIDATRAMHAFAHGHYDDAVQSLRRVRPLAQRFGGSHAQRDIIDLTLIEAASRAGDNALADALRRERAFLRH
jgi:tetratricopeptide (TPR) repeat protein